MKLFIDNVEIKTVADKIVIQGSMGLVSRTCLFSYVYDFSDENYKKYKVKINSDILIQDDYGENVFRGIVVSIKSDKENKLLNIKAQDMLYPLITSKVTGRFKGEFIKVINNFFSKFEIVKDIKAILALKVNIISLGTLTVLDIISAVLSKIHGANFKIYLDANSKLKIFLPLIQSPNENLIIGENVFQASFSAEANENTVYIKALGNKNVVSGSTVRLINNDDGQKGDWIVCFDKHTYGNTYTMELELKERKLSL